LECRQIHLTNCKDYDPNEPAIFEPADNWIIQELNQTIAEATNNFEEYQ